MARELSAVVLLIVLAVPYIQAVPTTPEQRCGACMEDLSGFRDALQAHVNKEDLLDLSELCAILSTESQAACRSLLTTTPLPGDEMMFASLCDAAAMCRKTSEEQPDEETMFFRSKPEVVFDVEEQDEGDVFQCYICQKVMRVGHSFLKKALQKRLLTKIKALCRFVPLFQNMCTCSVERFGSLALDRIVNFVNPQLCYILGLCQRAGDRDDFYKYIMY